MAVKYTKEVKAEGHLVDSGIMSNIFDTIIQYNGQFKVKEFNLGKTNEDPSLTRIEVSADSEKILNTIVGQLHLIGCYEVKAKEVTLKPAKKDTSVPSDFYSTTNHKTMVYHNGKWKEAQRQRMDTVIVINDDTPVCTLLRDVKKGDNIVVGLEGIQVRPEFKERSREFAFMDNEVSSERKVEITVKKLANLMRDIKKKKGKIGVVAGPVVIHTGGAEALAKLIKDGFVDVLLAGNALAVHDVEQQLCGTSLGVNTQTGMQVNHGHKNHMVAINAINTVGSIKAAVEQGMLKAGIMYECVKNNVPFVLAGSLRDDGPLPETEMDLIKAQAEYSKSIQDLDLVLMLSSMLHSIGTGNMMPSRIKTFCVDINQAVVTKLADRGSAQAVGIVTDVGLFLQLLGKEI